LLVVAEEKVGADELWPKRGGSMGSQKFILADHKREEYQ
jgi:hypothetical protein